jgi:DNA repair protein RadC
MKVESSIAVPEIKINFKPGIKASERVSILSSQACVNLLREQWEMSTFEIREEMKLVVLNRSGKALGIFALAVGGVSHCPVDPKVVFLITLKTPGAETLILVHNHPSGNRCPSQSDKLVAEKIKAGAAILGLKLSDFIILTTESYYSFADEGCL